MSPNPNIRYVRRHEIDTTRWDACIDQSANSILYGFHFYLDHTAAGRWDALILDDYQAVMPLPWRRKYGIRYLCQPPFTQQTGIFSPQPLSHRLIEAFLQTARNHFRFAELFLNYGNALPALQPKKNFILDLHAPYLRITSHYKPHLSRNLKNATDHELRYMADTDLPAAIEGYRRIYGARTPHVTAKDYDRLEALCRQLLKKDRLVLRTVSDPAGTPLATALLPRDNHRLYLLLPVTFPAGRKVKANHFLLDQLIREFAGQPLLLDFEGSDIPGIARFYSDFGGIPQPYFFYRFNDLPWPISRLKR
ncbi:MAG TPA: GNAT family N-acetyltransferase [Verrucomicrobiae bacterium]|nr:GNAT family N-acetyltransferase [Verrucomicrobiae bacterium]